MPVGYVLTHIEFDRSGFQTFSVKILICIVELNYEIQIGGRDTILVLLLKNRFVAIH